MKTRIDYDQAEFARVQEHKKWKKKFYRKQRWYMYFAICCYAITFFTFFLYNWLPVWSHAFIGMGMGFMFAHASIYARQEIERTHREEHDDATV